MNPNAADPNKATHQRRHHVDKQRKSGGTFIVPTPSTLGDDDDADDDDGREREREREREM